MVALEQEDVEAIVVVTKRKDPAPMKEEALERSLFSAIHTVLRELSLEWPP